MSSVQRPLDGFRILVADDEVLIAELLIDILEDLGAETLGPVQTVDAIIHAIASDPPDAVTLDVNLQGEFVYRALPGIQERNIPFIFVTAYSHLPECPEHLEDAPHLVKPFRAKELATAFNKLLGNEASSRPG